MKPETLEAASQDVEMAYYLIHSMGSGGDFEARDRKAAKNFGEASAAGRRAAHYLSRRSRPWSRPLAAPEEPPPRVDRRLIESIKHLTVVRDATALEVFPVQPIEMSEAIAAAIRNEEREIA